MNVILSQFFIFFIFTSISLHLQAQSTCQKLFENNEIDLESQIGEQQERLLFRRLYSFSERLKNSKFFGVQFELKNFDLPAPELVPTVQLMMEHITPIVERLLRPGVLESYDLSNDNSWRHDPQEVRSTLQKIYDEGKVILKNASQSDDKIPFNQIFSFIVRAMSIYDFMPAEQLRLDMSGDETITVQPIFSPPIQLNFNEYVQYNYLYATRRLLKRDKHPFMYSESVDGTIHDYKPVSALSLPFFFVGKKFEPQTQIFAERFGINLISIISRTTDNMSPSRFFDHDLITHFARRSISMHDKIHDLNNQVREDSTVRSKTIGTIIDVYYQQQAFMDFLMAKIQEAYSTDPIQYAEYWGRTEELFHERGNPPHPVLLLTGYPFSHHLLYTGPIPIRTANDPDFISLYHKDFLFHRQIAIWTAEYLSQDPRYKKLSKTILKNIKQLGTSLIF